MNLPDRLMCHRRITVTDCWEWTRAVTEHGYGRISWKNKPRKVHRVVAHLVYGIDLDGIERVLHTCDNPPCFNPAHLVVGTQLENVHDMVSKGRAAGGDKPHSECRRGHALTPENLKISRSGKRRCRECAQRQSRRYYARRKQREGAFWATDPSRQPIRALDGIPEPELAT